MRFCATDILQLWSYDVILLLYKGVMQLNVLLLFAEFEWVSDIPPEQLNLHRVFTQAVTRQQARLGLTGRL